MSETTDVLELIAKLTGDIDAQIGQVADPQAKQILVACRDVIQQSSAEFAQLAAEIPTVESVEKEMAASNAKRAPLLAAIKRQAEELKTKTFSNDDVIAAADGLIRDLKARFNRSPPPPMAPDFVPPLRESLLRGLGYLDNGVAAVSSGPSLTQWAMESASVASADRSAGGKELSSDKFLEMADGLDERRAIWWACLAITDVAARKGAPLTADLEEQIAHCCQWVLDPQASKPKVIEPPGNIETEGEPAALLSLALHFAGGEKSKFEGVIPGPRRSQRCAANAVVRAIWSNPKAGDQTVCNGAIELGSQISRGLRLWPSLSPEEVEKQSAKGGNSFESWLNASLGSERK